MANLQTTFLNQVFRNPVIPAAGPNVGSGDLLNKVAEGGAGGLLCKTISVEAAKVPHPNMTRYGKDSLLNTELWSELSPEEWLTREYDIAIKSARDHGIPIIASIGYTGEELALLGPKLEAKGIDLIEFSIHYLDMQKIVETVQSLRNAVKIPIIAKLSPHSGDLGELAKIIDPYVDGFACINSFGPTLMIDIEKAESPLGSKFGYGWISGQALKPLAVRSVFEVARVTSKPIIGVGGVSRGEDVIEYLMAGASLVGVCTAALLNGPAVYGKIAAEAERWLEQHGYKDIAEVKGLFLEKYRQGQQVETEVKQMAVVDENLCKACGICGKVCQYDALHAPLKEKASVEPDKCAACGLCVSVCPFGALSLQER